jgi:hypothetical protein
LLVDFETKFLSKQKRNVKKQSVLTPSMPFPSHLNLAQFQARRNLTSLRETQIFFSVKFPLQLQQLLARERRPSPPRFRSRLLSVLVGIVQILVVIVARLVIVGALGLGVAELCEINRNWACNGINYGLSL